MNNDYKNFTHWLIIFETNTGGKVSQMEFCERNVAYHIAQKEMKNNERYETYAIHWEIAENKWVLD